MYVSDPRTELGDSVCDFEKVMPDELCPSAKKRLTGAMGLGLGSGSGSGSGLGVFDVNKVRAEFRMFA